MTWLDDIEAALNTVGGKLTELDAALEAGAKGPKGDQGDQGIQGIQGIQGTQGNAGTNGSNGADATSIYGDPIGVAHLPASMLKAAAVTADVTHAQSSTALSNVTGLSFPIGASATEMWQFELLLLVSAASTTPDCKLGLTFPTGVTGLWGTMTNSSGSAVGGTPAAAATQAQTVIFGANSGSIIAVVVGVVFGGGNAGTVQLQFAQSTADASNLTILKGSSMRYGQIAS